MTSLLPSLRGYAPVANQVTANGVNPEGWIPVNGGDQTTSQPLGQNNHGPRAVPCRLLEGNVNVRHDIPP